MADNNYVAEQVMLAGGKNFASQEAEESVLYSLLLTLISNSGLIL